MVSCQYAERRDGKDSEESASATGSLSARGRIITGVPK